MKSLRQPMGWSQARSVKPEILPDFWSPFPRLEPRRHWSVDFKAMKESLTLRYRTITSYLSFFFSESFSARALWNLVHSWLITPDVVKTSGVNEPCSTSIILLLYFRFFSFSCLFRTVSILVFCWLALSKWSKFNQYLAQIILSATIFFEF